MSLSTLGFLVVILAQTKPLDDESAGSRLQIGPLQGPVASSVQEPSEVGLAAPNRSEAPSPAVLPASPSPPHRSIYDGQLSAADSAPALGPSRRDLGTSEPAVLPSATLAESLLQEALSAPERDGVQGSPTALKSLLGQTTMGIRRMDAVTAYWRLTHAIAAHHYALDEQRFLMSLAAANEGDDQPLLAAVRATAKAEAAETRLAVLRAQQALAEIASPTLPAERALPADPPFVGPYRTYFQELNERGAAGQELRPIDETLPLLHELVAAQADAVAAAGAVLNQVQRAREHGQASLIQVLDAQERLRRHRRAFLSAVEQYNGQIARYALSVSVPAATGERVVAMLIGTGKGHKSVLASKKDGSTIQRVSGEEPVTEENGGPVFRTPKR